MFSEKQRLMQDLSVECYKAGSPNYGPQAKSGRWSHFIRPQWHFVNNKNI